MMKLSKKKAAENITKTNSISPTLKLKAQNVFAIERNNSRGEKPPACLNLAGGVAKYV
jgi:hypothetical protein